VENAPAGTKAKLEFLKKGMSEMVQSSYVARLGEDFTCFSPNTLTKKAEEYLTR
jgi:hypothetical protein